MRPFLAVVRRRWRWTTAVVLVSLALATAFASLSTPSYRSTASVWFSLQSGSSASDLVQGSTYAQNQVASFAALATTPVVLQPVVDELRPGTSTAALADRVTAEAPIDTVLVDVTVVDTDADAAAEIANAIADSLSTTIERIAPRNAQDDPTVRATIVAPAAASATPWTPDWVAVLLTGLAAGVLLGVGAAYTRDALDNRVRDAGVLGSVTALPLLGSIGEQSAAAGRTVVVESAPDGVHAEFFRQLKTNLQFLDVAGQGLQTVLVTSALPGEGKSTVAANLAAALAETEGSVLLVDADLRRPTQAGILGIEGSVGLSTVLLGRARVSDVVQEWGRSGLHVLPAGATPPNPGELLAAPALRRLIEELRGRYDHVVIDTAPVLPVADAAVLSRVVDGTLVVANVTRVRRPQLGEALASLAQVGARTLGVVLNQVRRDTEAYAYESVHESVHESVLESVPDPGHAVTATAGGRPAAVRPRPAELADAATATGAHRPAGGSR